MGWRGGFWFYPFSSFTVLLSENEGSCLGENGNYGEYIIYHEVGQPKGVIAWDEAQSVLDVDGYAAGHVDVSPANWVIPDSTVDPDLYYKDRFWIHVVHGTGVGQSPSVRSVTRAKCPYLVSICFVL